MVRTELHWKRNRRPVPSTMFRRKSGRWADVTEKVNQVREAERKSYMQQHGRSNGRAPPSPAWLPRQANSSSQMQAN